MKSVLNLGVVVGLIAVLSGCGEAFQGKFIGEGRLQNNTCDGQDKSPYTIEVKAQVAGDSMEITVLRFVNRDGSSDTVSGRFFQVQAGLTLENDTFFYVDNQKFKNNPHVTVSVSGTISQTRDEIAPFDMTLNTLDSGGSPCLVSVRSNILKLQER